MINAGSTQLNNAWKNVLHNQAEDYIIPESDVNVVCPYDCVSTSGYTVSAIHSSANSSIYSLARENDVINRNKKIATFEWNFWVLDGSFEVLDTHDIIKGFMTDTVSNSERRFLGGTPYVNFDFSEGFLQSKNQTLKFAPVYNEVPAEITIFSMNGDTTISSVYFDIESQLDTDNLQEQEYVHLYSNAINDITEITRVGIAFTKTLLPYRRARLTEYNNGYYFYLDKYDLQTFNHSRTLSLCMDELPQNDLEISFADLEGIFDERNTSAPFHIGFTKSHKFYVFNGYNFDNIGWNYVKVDSVAFDTLEFDRDSLITTIKGKSTLLNHNQKYPTNQLQKNPYAPRPSGSYWWEHFWGLINTIRYISNMPTIYRDSLTVPFLETSYVNWQIYLYASLGVENDFAKTPAVELLQQCMAVLNCCLVRNPDETLQMRYMVNRPLDFVDSIEGAFMTSYPTSTKEDGYKTIYVDTPPLSSAQKPDDDVDYTIEGSQIVEHFYRTRLGFAVNNSNSTIEETELKPNIIVLRPRDNTDGWYWSAGESASALFNSYANQYNNIHEATRYEVSDTFLNPLLQVADLITINPSEDIKIYRGYIEKIEINYDGSFRGAITICSIDD